MNHSSTVSYTVKSKLLARLAILLMLLSTGLRLLISPELAGNGQEVLLLLIIPVAAGLLFSLCLELNGEKRFFKTIGPFSWLAFYALARILLMPLDLTTTALLIAADLLLFLLFRRTFSGVQKTQLPLLLLFVLFTIVLVCAPEGRPFVLAGVNFSDVNDQLRLSDSSMAFSLILALLSIKRLPSLEEGEPYRLRRGDRLDGRRIYGIDPMAKLSAYFMVNRNGANNLLKDKIRAEAIEEYIHKKRKEGYSHFGITHILLASYVRTVAELPALNRFISGQKIYSRFQIVVNMVVKKELKKESPDTVIKIVFDPGDTAGDVYRKFEEKLKEAQSPALDSNFDKLAEKFDYIPGLLLKFVVWLLKTMDYFGCLPTAITDLSPFHGSMFVTSMGSLGIPPIYHHLYDFGNVPVFCAFGVKRTAIETGEDGEIKRKKYLDYSFVTDERIVDGFYYAAALKKMRHCMLNPDLLDVAPERIVEDIL